jgi:hypothetical protein
MTSINAIALGAPDDGNPRAPSAAIFTDSKNTGIAVSK